MPKRRAASMTSKPVGKEVLLGCYKYRDDNKLLERVKSCEALASKGVVRDVMSLYPETFTEAFKVFIKEMLVFEDTSRKFEEFTEAVFRNVFNDENMLGLFFGRFGKVGEGVFLQKIVQDIYQLLPNLRPLIRSDLGSLLTNANKISFATNILSGLSPREKARAAHVALTLTTTIIKGFKLPLSPQNQKLLIDRVLPLHGIPGKLSHLKPLLQVIHKPLVAALRAFIEKAPGVFGKIIRGVLSSWPKRSSGNTPKEVLLLTELTSLLEFGKQRGLKLTKLEAGMVAARLTACVSCQNRFLIRLDAQSFKTEAVRAFEMAAAQSRQQNSLESASSRKSGDDPSSSSSSSSSSSFADKVQKLVLRVNTSPDQARNGAKGVEMEDDKGESKGDNSRDKDMKLEEGHDSKITKKPTNDAAVDEAASSKEEKDLNLFKLVFGKDLGKGSFATVRHAQRILKGKARSQWRSYAVKEIKKEHEKVARREVNVMRRFSHPNIIGFVSFFASSRHFHIVSEYAQNGDLHSLIVRLGPIAVENTRFTAAEILSAVEHIHSFKYVFGDLKPENVLMMESGHAKLSDFGACRHISECKGGAAIEGTAIYLPPEVLKGGDSSYLTDWSNDVEIVARSSSVRFDVDNGLEAGGGGSEYSKAMEKRFPESHFDAKSRGLVGSLLLPKQSERLGRSGAGALKNHPFFKDVDFATLHRAQPPKIQGSGAARPKGDEHDKMLSFSLVFFD
eukprot:jgi/Bigna1/137444/aug1.39_g12152